MKRTTILAIVAAAAGIALVLYLASRPRTASTGTLAAANGEAPPASPSEAARVTTAIGTGLTGIVAGIAEAAT